MPGSTPRPRRSASTGSAPGRRAFLAGRLQGPPRERRRPPERGTLDELERLEADLLAELAAIAGSGDAAADFAASVRRSLARHRDERARLRRELGLVPAAPRASAGERAADLEALRDAQEALVLAHAEAIGRLGRSSTGTLVDHLTTLASQLTVIELWIERERGLD